MLYLDLYDVRSITDTIIIKRDQNLLYCRVIRSDDIKLGRLREFVGEEKSISPTLQSRITLNFFIFDATCKMVIITNALVLCAQRV